MQAGARGHPSGWSGVLRAAALWVLLGGQRSGSRQDCALLNRKPAGLKGRALLLRAEGGEAGRAGLWLPDEKSRTFLVPLCIPFAAASSAL